MFRQHLRWMVILTSAIAGGFTAAAQASSGMTPEVELASYVILCEGHAKKFAPQDISFWQEVKTEVDAADLRTAERNLGAVESSLSQIDPALIARRCSDFKDVWNDPEGSDYEEPSEQVQAMTAKVQENMSGLINQLAVANFAPDNANIAVKYMVTISNATPDRLDAAVQMDDALTVMRKSLAAQTKVLATPNFAALLSDQDRNGFYICAASAAFKASQTFDAGQYDIADKFIAERILWSALINRERKLGEDLLADDNMRAQLPNSIAIALSRLKPGDRLGLDAQPVINKAEDMCRNTVSAQITDRFITAPVYTATRRKK